MFNSKYEALKTSLSGHSRALDRLASSVGELTTQVNGIHKAVCNLGSKLATNIESIGKSLISINGKHDALKKRVELLEQYLGIEFFTEASVHTEGYRKIKKVKDVKKVKKTKKVTKPKKK